MHSGPSKAAEAIVAMLLPPACREEIVGDLHERFTSPPRYALDALRTVPLVIISRIRCTLDLQVLVIQAFALYLSFVGAAWLADRALLDAPWGHVRLAIPPAIAILGLVLAAAYTKAWGGPAFGVILAFASQELLRIGTLDVALPRWPLAYGYALSFVLASVIRLLFRPVTSQPRRPLR